MKDTISVKLLNDLQNGKNQLGEEALLKVTGFVNSQRTKEDSFIDKSGKPDLYYTSFGWLLSYILRIKLDYKKMALYLSEYDENNLDLIHYAAYTRCKMLKEVMTKGKVGVFLQSLFSTEIRKPESFDNIPHNDINSPYTKYILLSLFEDSGHKIKDKETFTESLSKYHSPNGGYMNTQDGISATTNASVAALAVTGQLKGYKHNADVDYLYNIQDISGGFAAAKNSPVPDLLSTATSLFILNCYGLKAKYPAKDFIEAHWLDSGGFSATLLDDKSDVEYTFYGLLALGAA